MNLMRDADLSKLRIRKMAWMRDDCYHITIAFTDNDSDTMPTKPTQPPYEIGELIFGTNPSHESNGPNVNMFNCRIILRGRLEREDARV